MTKLNAQQIQSARLLDEEIERLRALRGLPPRSTAEKLADIESWRRLGKPKRRIDRAAK